MKKTASLALFAALGLASAQMPAHPQAAPNTLTPAEKEAGWKLLWDGKTTDGWRSSKSHPTPFSPPSGLTQRLFQEPPAKSKFLAVI